MLSYGLVVAYALVLGRVKRFALFFTAFPVTIYYLNRAFKALAARFIKHREAQLKALQEQQHRQLEALKEATGYYRTKTLIEKFEDAPKKQQPSKSQSPKKPEDGKDLPGIKHRPIPSKNPSPRPASPKPQLPAPQPALPVPLLPGYKSPTWMDRLLDAIIGDDSRNQKFALICQRCFNHNGLAPVNATGTFRYRCPNCAFMNAQQFSTLPSPPAPAPSSIAQLPDKAPAAEEAQQPGAACPINCK